jgi:hypothetical protein
VKESGCGVEPPKENHVFVYGFKAFFFFFLSGFELGGWKGMRLARMKS